MDAPSRTTVNERPDRIPTPARPSRLRSILLWLVALLLMLGAGAYQRRTGPTYDYRGALTVDGQQHAYRLLRSEETTRDVVVVVPNPGGKLGGTLHWRRYPTDGPFQQVPLQADAAAATLTATLPRQPAAGKLEYHLELTTPAGPARIPAAADEEIVLRFKDPVPLAWLVSHVAMMFLSMMVGLRAGLSALFQTHTMARYAWTALVGLFAGGLVLGPIVQKYAFGAFWTGWPFGYDLTDNKQLVMWLCWLLACGALALRPRNLLCGRTAVLLASAVMIVVYLIPHSLRGSQLDYGKLQQGVDPKHAIETGK